MIIRAEIINPETSTGTIKATKSKVTKDRSNTMPLIRVNSNKKGIGSPKETTIVSKNTIRVARRSIKSTTNTRSKTTRVKAKVRVKVTKEVKVEAATTIRELLTKKKESQATLKGQKVANKVMEKDPTQVATTKEAEVEAEAAEEEVMETKEMRLTQTRITMPHPNVSTLQV